MKKEQKLFLLLGLFVAAIICGNLLGSKVTVILGITASVGIIAYPLTFLITDIVEEVFGKQKTKLFIKAGFWALILTLVLVILTKALPPAGIYTNNDAYNAVFSSSLRILIASIISFIVSQTVDIWSFNLLKQKTKGKALWLRNNLSTMSSQFIDTTLFMFIAFYMMTPDFTFIRIIGMIIPYWLLKVLFAFLDTPLVYLGVKWLKR